MTELGVYILGATALYILAAAGIHLDNAVVIFCAAVSAGAAYLGQVAACLAGAGRGGKTAVAVNLGAASVAIAVWAYGVIHLL